jgi:hypothetical protein
MYIVYLLEMGYIYYNLQIIKKEVAESRTHKTCQGLYEY